MAGDWLWMRISEEWGRIQVAKGSEIPCYFPC